MSDVLVVLSQNPICAGFKGLRILITKYCLLLLCHQFSAA
jgi:hypothetical protein